MFVQVEYMGKTYLCSVMSDWVDMIEELGGDGVMDEDNPLWDTIAGMVLQSMNESS